jgi:hypothetical protein
MLSGARASTRKSDAIQRTRGQTHIRNKKILMPIQGTRGCPKAYRTGDSKRKQKITHWAGSRTYRGLGCLRSVTPLPSSEWMSTSTPVHPDSLDTHLFMFPSGPVLPQVQVLDLLGHLPHFQPSLGELQLDTERLHFIEELVNLH